MKRMNLTPAEIAADDRFDGALEHADAWLGDYAYTPVVFTITRKGKLQWRSVDDAGRVVRQFNWHANARVWVWSTFSWSYRPKVPKPRIAQFPSIALGHQGPIQAGDPVSLGPDPNIGTPAIPVIAAISTIGLVNGDGERVIVQGIVSLPVAGSRV